MVVSILDTDLYKLSMASCYFQLYKNAEGTFKFNDRNGEVYDEKFLEMLKMDFAKLASLRLTDEEYNYLFTIRYLPTNFIEWMKGFHFELDKINVWLDDKGHLQIEVTDLMYKATFYEVPILAIVSECRNKYLGVSGNLQNMMNILDEKINFANEYGLKFSEFGTRRRYSYNLQEKVVERLKEKCPINCVGTSNVYLAMKYGMKCVGTMAHEMFQFHQALYGFKTANVLTLDAWSNVFGGDLGIALIDTFTTNSFLHTLTLKQAKLFDGMRQDSGDEYKIGNMIIDKYKSMGIDPKTKTIVFSNALNFSKYKDIADYFKGRINVSAGIGTNLTCDTGIDGYKPANIVMKLSRARYSSRDFWNDTIKISDDLGKHSGNTFLFEVAKKELHLEELGVKL